MPQITYQLSFVQLDIIEDTGVLVPGCLGWLQESHADNNLSGGAASNKFYFFKDLIHALSGSNPVAIIEDHLTGAEATAVAAFVPPPGTSLAAALLGLYINAAKSHKTVQSVVNGVPQVDAGGKPVMVSPFESATVVVLPVMVGTP